MEGTDDKKPEGLAELEQLAAEHPGIISIEVDHAGEMHEGAGTTIIVAVDGRIVDEALARIAAIDAGDAGEVEAPEAVEGETCPVTHSTGDTCLRVVPGHKRHFGGNIGWWD